MKGTFYKILRLMNLEAEEASLVFLLLTQSVFLGVFFGAFDTAANALFLGVFPSDWLPFGFTVSGVAGIILTTLYSNLQSKILFNKLALLNLAAVAILTFILWFGFSITQSKWHVFMVLVMMGPLNILAMLGFWGTAGRLFTLRQGKRLFGLVDAGQIIGVILVSYAIPVILSFNIKTKDLLLLSSICVAISFIFQFILSFKTTTLSEKVIRTKEAKEGTGLLEMLKNPFVRLMSIFVALSMVTAFFISFSFLAATNLKYPDMNGFATFLGVFVGTVMIFTLLIKTLVYGKFMKSYGLRTSLIISPALLLILSIIATIVGMAGGSTTAAAGFVFFFLIIALSRLFSVALKSAIEIPSFKILYQTIDAKIRHHIQARVDGTINEISALFSGLLLLVLGSLSFMKLINFTQALILLLLAWGWVAYKLYKAYKSNLVSSLSNLQFADSKTETKGSTGIARRLLKGNEETDQVLLVLNMQEKLQPIIYERLIPYLLHHKKNKIKEYALNKGSDLHVYEMLEILNEVNETDLIDQSKKLAIQLKGELEKGFAQEQIVTLSRSKIVADRELAARLAGEQNDPKMAHYLKFLLRDFDPGVKIAAIKAAARLKNSELAPLLAEFLTTDSFGRYASDALIEIGEGAVDCIENIFNKIGNDSLLQLRIVRIIGNIGGSKACKSLLYKINYHDAEVARLASQMLISLKYRVDKEHYYIVNQSLLQLLSVTAWNIAARASLKDAREEILLQNAFASELHTCFDQIFTLLSLAFDAQSIKHIRQNIESDSAESTGYALELLELIIAEDLKPILFSILDDSSDTEKISQLQHYFPVDKMPVQNLVHDIINRDYNYIGAWTKACALNSLLLAEKTAITDDIIAQLFNTDEVLSGLAALIIQKNNPQLLPKLFIRLIEKQRIKIQQTLKLSVENTEILMFNKLLFLQQLKQLNNLPGNTLYYLAKSLNSKQFTEGDEIETINDDLAIQVYIIARGSVVTSNNQLLTPGTFFGGVFAPEYPKYFPNYYAKGDLQVYFVLQDIFDRILFDCPELAEKLILSQMTLQSQ